MKPTELTDRQILDILHLASLGFSHSTIATMTGQTRAQIGGLLLRIRSYLDKAEEAGIL